jgi:hypothetical protein
MIWWGVLITVFGSLIALGFFVILGFILATAISVGKEFKK